MKNTNIDGSMAFTPEDVERGSFAKFVDLLCEMDYEFRVCSDGYCRIVDYVTRCRAECGDHFEIWTEEDVEALQQDAYCDAMYDMRHDSVTPTMKDMYAAKYGQDESEEEKSE